MSAIGKFLDKIRQRRGARRALASGGEAGGLSVTPATGSAPPVIHGAFGDTTEAVRLQAARNIAADPEVRARVVALLTARMGTEDRAIAYMRQAYPEAFGDD